MDDLPPGFRFYPTEEELVSFYLQNKLEGRRQQDLDRVIPVLYIYHFNPWDLPQFAGELCRGDSEQWFFFIPRQEKEARGGRPNRLTTSGYWKATGSPGDVYSPQNRVIGRKRTMVFYIGRAPTGRKTEWKMNEYKAIEGEAPSSSTSAISQRNFIDERQPNYINKEEKPTRRSSKLVKLQVGYILLTIEVDTKSFPQLDGSCGFLKKTQTVPTVQLLLLLILDFSSSEDLKTFFTMPNFVKSLNKDSAFVAPGRLSTKTEYIGYTETGILGVDDSLREEFSLCRVYKNSNCLRAFDRRPSAAVGGEAMVHQAHHVAGDDDEAATTSHQNHPTMERIASSPESSSSGDHANIPSQTVGSDDMAVDNDPFWDWEQFDWY
ncbi:hypothetical protein HYC85_006919 [Camellia sinensis]|uniref:NAC domain-containing protein n=1 Tax=Camellia sinensis TaxID=4442 RepID=A0A7J7HMH3_CAMSI|nr:hypothetical protein HYC85_006919 [Camellia sinensis]